MFPVWKISAICSKTTHLMTIHFLGLLNSTNHFAIGILVCESMNRQGSPYPLQTYFCVWSISGSATSMNSMFMFAAAFNQPISHFDTANVVDVRLLCAVQPNTQQDSQYYSKHLIIRWQTCLKELQPSISPYISILPLWQMWELFVLTSSTIMNHILMDFCYTPNNQMGYMFNLAWAFNQPVNLDTATVTRVRRIFVLSSPAIIN